MKIVKFDGVEVPELQTKGNAAKFITPFAKEFCKGIGYDIGCNRMEWCLSGAIPVDPLLDDRFHATNLPFGKKDFIFSSHCLEHVTDPWYDVLKYWYENISDGGVIFLYLSSYESRYWRPWNNKKHVHIFTPEIMKDAFIALGMKNVFVSGIDLMNSFAIVGEK